VALTVTNTKYLIFVSNYHRPMFTNASNWAIKTLTEDFKCPQTIVNIGKH